MKRVKIKPKPCNTATKNRQQTLKYLKSRSSGNDFNQFTGDDGLSGTIECQAELVYHFAGVLAGVFHGSHTGGLFAARALFQRVVDERRQRKLDVALEDIAVQRVVYAQFGGGLNKNT